MAIGKMKFPIVPHTSRHSSAERQERGCTLCIADELAAPKQRIDEHGQGVRAPYTVREGVKCRVRRSQDDVVRVWVSLHCGGRASC